MEAKPFHVVSIVCSLIALLCVLVALISASQSTALIESLYWGIVEFDANYDFFYSEVQVTQIVGLLAAIFTYEDSDFSVSSKVDCSTQRRVYKVLRWQFRCSWSIGAFCDLCTGYCSHELSQTVW